MGKLYEILDEELRGWIAQQKVFFVATAPLAGDAHVNCSPKGGNTFCVISEREVAYLDLTGSGIETIAHVQENGRIVIMFCAFSGPPRIVRLYGRADVIYPGHAEFVAMTALFPAQRGVRAVVRVKLTRISDSCGHGVPLFDFAGCRDVLDSWAEKKGEQGLAAYRNTKNKASIDGIAGYQESGSASAPPISD